MDGEEGEEGWLLYYVVFNKGRESSYIQLGVIIGIYLNLKGKTRPHAQVEIRVRKARKAGWLVGFSLIREFLYVRLCVIIGICLNLRGPCSGSHFFWNILDHAYSAANDAEIVRGLVCRYNQLSEPKGNP